MAIGQDWGEFCEALRRAGNPRVVQFRYDRGHKGLGVCVSTGYGDGSYPVYAEFDAEGNVAKVWVEFIPEHDLEATEE